MRQCSICRHTDHCPVGWTKLIMAEEERWDCAFYEKPTSFQIGERALTRFRSGLEEGEA